MWIWWKILFKSCEFCEKIDVQDVNFVKIETLNISFFFFFLKNMIFIMWILKNWDFHNVNFWMNWWFLPQCVSPKFSTSMISSWFKKVRKYSNFHCLAKKMNAWKLSVMHRCHIVQHPFLIFEDCLKKTSCKGTPTTSVVKCKYQSSRTRRSLCSIPNGITQCFSRFSSWVWKQFSLFSITSDGKEWWKRVMEKGFSIVMEKSENCFQTHKKHSKIRNSG